MRFYKVWFTKIGIFYKTKLINPAFLDVPKGSHISYGELSIC